MTDDTHTDDGAAGEATGSASEVRSDGGHASEADGATSEPRSDGGHATGELPGETHDEHGLPGYGTVRRWLVTTNHKDIGILYTVTALFFLVFGGTMALLLRLQLWTTGGGLMEATAYNQAVSTHGLLMVFWFISPFAFGLANYLVPLQIGADDLAFPRLNALSYWLYLSSGLLMGVSFFQEATFSGGWTLYAPLNMPAYMPEPGATSVVLALVMFVAGITLGSVNFLTTIHRMRAEGMRIRDVPLFSMSILLTVWMMLFAFAALLAALIILGSDHIIGTTYFRAVEGGSLLWAHLFWFFGHPEVYIVFFPALGIMAETFQTFTGRRIVGRKWFVASMVLVALQSFVVWMHHMFLTSINLEIKTLFMATTIGISLPFDLMVFALIYTMIKGRIRFTTPFLFNFGALLLFIVGGITGVFLGAVVLDYEFRGTYWVVAHFHYVMVGGAIAMIGGLYYWYPKITGKMYDEFLGKVHFATMFVGFNLLYFPQFVAWETPRRVFHYQPDLVVWHQLSTVGAFVFGGSFFIMFYNMVDSYWHGEDAGDNPWEYASTAEWAVPSPPPLENFPGVPSYRTGALNFLTPSADGAGEGEAATDGGAGGLVTHEPELSTHEEHADHASIWPFTIGLASLVTMAGFSALDLQTFTWPLLAFIPAAVTWMGVAQWRHHGSGVVPAAVSALGLAGFGALGGGYLQLLSVGDAPMLGGYGILATVGTVLLAITLVELGAESFSVPEPPLAEAWPFDGVEKTKLGLWFFLASDIVLFGGFIGSYLFMRVAYGWSSWHHEFVPAEHVVLPGLLNTYILLTSSFAVVLALVAAEKESRAGVVASLVTTLVLGVAFLANKAIEWLHLFNLHSGEFADTGWTFSTNIASSTFYLTTGLHGAHVTVGLLVLVWMIARAWRGAYQGDERRLEYFGLYWHFVDIVWLFLFPLFYIV